MRRNSGEGSSRPGALLALDVDGVLNPCEGAVCPPGYQEHDFFPGEEPVRLCPAHGPWLRELAVPFELVWATGWGTEANRLLAPVLGLPELPVVALPPGPFDPAEKLSALASFAGRRPLAWIDDMLSGEAHQWASGRAAPALLLRVSPAEGLTCPVVDRDLCWIAELAG